MNYQELGFAILKRRRKKNLSQVRLAALSGVSRNYISQIEQGKAQGVSVDILVKLAEVLDVDPAHWVQVLTDKD